MKNKRYPEPRIWKTLTLWDKPEHRFEDCPNYDKCLNLAAKLNWPGFTCLFCPLNKLEQERLEKEEWIEKRKQQGKVSFSPN